MTGYAAELLLRPTIIRGERRLFIDIPPEHVRALLGPPTPWVRLKDAIKESRLTRWDPEAKMWHAPCDRFTRDRIVRRFGNKIMITPMADLWAEQGVKK